MSIGFFSGRYGMWLAFAVSIIWIGILAWRAAHHLGILPSATEKSETAACCCPACALLRAFDCPQCRPSHSNQPASFINPPLVARRFMVGWASHVSCVAGIPDDVIGFTARAPQVTQTHCISAGESSKTPALRSLGFLPLLLCCFPYAGAVRGHVTSGHDQLRGGGAQGRGRHGGF